VGGGVMSAGDSDHFKPSRRLELSHRLNEIASRQGFAK
jgi:hypothetical protein